MSFDLLLRDVEKRWGNINSDRQLRGFWNMVNMMMMGIWQVYSVQELTSIAVNWSLKKHLDIGKVRFSHRKIHRDLYAKTFSETKELLDKNQSLRDELLKRTKNIFGDIESGTIDPIIIIENNGKMDVLDGNNRLLYYLLNDISVVDAFVGSKNQRAVRDNWIPSEYLFRLSNYGSLAELGRLVEASTMARVEFECFTNCDNKRKNRVLRYSRLLSWINIFERFLAKVFLKL